MNTVRIYVAGTSYRQNEVAHLLSRRNTTVRFVPEPTNPYDPHAVRVEAEIDGNFVLIGYVPKTKTLILKRAILEKDYLGVKIGVVARSRPSAPLGVALDLSFETSNPVQLTEYENRRNRFSDLFAPDPSE